MRGVQEISKRLLIDLYAIHNRFSRGSQEIHERLVRLVRGFTRDPCESHTRLMKDSHEMLQRVTRDL